MSSSSLLAPRRHRRGRLRLAAVLAAAFALIAAPTVQAANAVNINIELPPAYSIAGTIRDNAGAALPNASVSAISAGAYGFAQTDAAGKYKITGLNPGQYQVMVTAPPTKNLVDGYYTTANPNHFTVSPASATKVTVGPNKAGIDVKLPVGYTISGTVTNTGGTPIAGVAVGATGPSFDQTTTDSLGRYKLKGLAAGTYKLSIRPAGNTNYLTGFYSSANANKFVVPAASASGIVLGPNKSGVNIKIPTGYSIAGTITNTAGAPLANVSVNAFSASYSRQVTTDAAGKYIVRGLAAGTYKLAVNPDYNTVYMDGFYTSLNSNRFTSLPASATGLVVGPNKTGINIKVLTGYTISGTITTTGTPGTPIAGAYVSSYGGPGGYRDAITDAAGKYKIEGLATGSYKLSISPPFGPNLQTGFYTTANANRFTSVFGSATAIAVGPSKTGINIKIPAGFSIAGKITKAIGVALDSAFVYVTSANSSGIAFTAADGTYKVIGLSAGTYKVQASPPYGQNLQNGYYTTANAKHFTPNPASATGVTIGP